MKKPSNQEKKEHIKICNNCSLRKSIAKRFDMHFDWLDCWYDCPNDYEHWLKSKED